MLLVLLVFVPGIVASRTNDWQIRGTSLGGAFVLEPWITPTLFYQFQGKAPDETAIDGYTFCEVLGTVEANKQLRAHFSSWVLERDIQRLKSYGLNTLRLPVGDYMYSAYGPYKSSKQGEPDCFDGALEQVSTILGWASKYGMNVFIDLHTTMGGQNGFDNGGLAQSIVWYGNGEYTRSSQGTWLTEDMTVPSLIPTSKGKWRLNPADGTEPPAPAQATYNISSANLQHTVQVLERIATLYASTESVVGLLPLVNEPMITNFQSLPQSYMQPLKDFYMQVVCLLEYI